MNVSLPRELETFVQDQVTGGHYPSASDVIREALILLQDRESADPAERAAFLAELDRRLEGLDRGEGLDAETVFAELRRKSERRRLAK